MVAHTFNNPSTREAEASGFLSSRPSWSTEWVPGQAGLHRKTMSQKKKKKKKRKEKENHTCGLAIMDLTKKYKHMSIYTSSS